MANKLFVSPLLGYGLAAGALVGVTAASYYGVPGGNPGVEFARLLTPSASFTPGEGSTPLIEAVVFGSELTPAAGPGAYNVQIRFGPLNLHHSNWTASSHAFFQRDDAGADIWGAPAPNLAPGQYGYIVSVRNFSPTQFIDGDLDGSNNGISPAQYGTLTVGEPEDPTQFIIGSLGLPWAVRSNRSIGGYTNLFNNSYSQIGETTYRITSDAGSILYTDADATRRESIDFTIGSLDAQAAYYENFLFDSGNSTPNITFSLSLLQGGPGSDVKRSLSSSMVFVGASIDPNEKLGPVGQGPNRNVLPGPFSYRINFENLSTATADAQIVTVVDEIEFLFEPGSLVFDAVGWSNNTYPVNFAGTNFSTSVDIPGNLRVDVSGELDTGVNPPTISWLFDTIDKGTNLPPVFDGFLPPNDGNGIGEGFVSFTITPSLALPLGTVIANEAVITFDDNAPINTSDPPNNGPWSNVLADLPPEVPALPIPANSSTDISVAVSQISSANAVGATSYDLYLWRQSEAKPTTPTAANLLQPVFTPPAHLSPATTYRWQVVAHNQWGVSPGPEWTFVTGQAISLDADKWEIYP